MEDDADAQLILLCAVLFSHILVRNVPTSASPASVAVFVGGTIIRIHASVIVVGRPSAARAAHSVRLAIVETVPGGREWGGRREGG